MVLYGFLEISKTMKGVAKITVRASFSCLLSQFFQNFEVSIRVLCSFLEISNTVVGVVNTAIFVCLYPCLPLLLQFSGIFQCRLWRSGNR